MFDPLDCGGKPRVSERDSREAFRLPHSRLACGDGTSAQTGRNYVLALPDLRNFPHVQHRGSS
jgi:hypothetical protein